MPGRPAGLDDSYYWQLTSSAFFIFCKNRPNKGTPYRGVLIHCLLCWLADTEWEMGVRLGFVASYGRIGWHAPVRQQTPPMPRYFGRSLYCMERPLLSRRKGPSNTTLWNVMILLWKPHKHAWFKDRSCFWEISWMILSCVCILERSDTNQEDCNANWWYNIMGLPLWMRLVIERNVDMQHMRLMFDLKYPSVLQVSSQGSEKEPEEICHHTSPGLP